MKNCSSVHSSRKSCRLPGLLLALLPCFSFGADQAVSGVFELVDHRGQTVTERSFAGKLRLVFFGFTECPDVCPTTLFEVRRALQQLGDAASAIQPLFISVDLKNDTPEKVATYVAAFHPSIIGLTGSAEQIDAAAKAFNVTWGVQPASESMNGRDVVYHSAYLFLMDREGKLLDVLGYGEKAELIAEKLRAYL